MAAHGAFGTDLSGVGNPPNPAGSVLENPILLQAQSAAETVVAKSVAAQEIMQGILQSTNVVAEEVKKAIQVGTTAKEVISSTAENAELASQNARIATLDAATKSVTFKRLMQELGEDTAAIVDSQDRLQELQDKPFTGVIDFFKTTFQIGEAKADVQDAKGRASVVGAAIRNISSAQESAARAIATTKATRNAATIAANSVLIAEQGKVDVSRAELESLGRNASQVEAGMRATATEAAARNAQWSLYNRIEDRKLRVTEEARRTQVHKFTIDRFNAEAATRILNEERLRKGLELTEIQLTQIKEAQEVMKIKSTAVMRAQAAAGLPIDEPEVIKAGLTASTAKERAKYEALFVIGSFEKPMLGATLGAADTNLTKIGSENLKITPAMEVLIDVKKVLNATYSASKPPPKTQEEYAVQLTAMGDTIATKMAGNIKAGDTTNFYSAPPMQVLAEYARVTDSALYTKVLKEMDLTEVDPAKIFEFALSAQEAGTISLEEAAEGIEAIGDSVADYNNSTKNLQFIGFPAQETYNTEILPSTIVNSYSTGILAGGLPLLAAVATKFGVRAFGEIGEPGTTNIMDRASIMQALTKIKADKVTRTSGVFR